MDTQIRRIALIAHDAKKPTLAEWAYRNRQALASRTLYATGTTARTIGVRCPDLNITALKSGPLGGDQQVGALIATEALDMLIFFADPMTPMPHDVDVKALTRLSTVYNIPMACNEATADFIIASPLFAAGYRRTIDDHSGYTGRTV